MMSVFAGSQANGGAETALRVKKSASEEALDCLLVRYFKFGFRERSLTVMGKYCHVPAGRCQRLKRR